MNLADGYDPTTQLDCDDSLYREWMGFLKTLKALSPHDGNWTQWTLVERVQIGEDVSEKLDDVTFSLMAR